MRKIANLEIRQTLHNLGVKQWELADAMGIRDDALSKKLRHELPDEERNKLLGLIYDISEAENSD